MSKDATAAQYFDVVADFLCTIIFFDNKEGRKEGKKERWKE